MINNCQLTSYCGLYCKDCIPSQTELFSLATHLEEILTELNFDKYAELKAGQTYWSESNATFKDYRRFTDVLQAIRGLKCQSICREGGGWKGELCLIRNCAIAKGLKGCWDCAEYKTCGHLEPLLKFHPNLAYHLELIKSEGIDEWAAKRRGHYPWG
ncbi:MAG: DUF3795 domain-containing protein [Dehalococcoidia bacterium]